MSIIINLIKFYVTINNEYRIPPIKGFATAKQTLALRLRRVQTVLNLKTISVKYS